MTRPEPLGDDVLRYLMWSPSCGNCRHRVGHRLFTCAAFPERVPIGIWNASDPTHREPVEGDHGIQFEPMDDDDRAALTEQRDRARARALELLNRNRARQDRPRLDAESINWDTMTIRSEPE